MITVLVARRMTCVATVVSTILGSSIVFAAKDNEDNVLTQQENSVETVLPAGGEQIGFGLPPRSIVDVQQMLADSFEPERLKTLNELKLAVSRNPPDSADSEALTHFYADRGAKAMQLGRAKQEVDDYRLALESYDKSPFVWEADRSGRNRGYSRLLKNLGFALGSGGSYNEAIVYLEQAGDNSSDGARIFISSTLALVLAKRGDLIQAEKYLKQAHGFLSNAKSQYWDRVDFVSARSIFATSGAEVALAKGHYTEAIELSNKAVRIMRPYKDKLSRSEKQKRSGRVSDSAMRSFLAALAQKARSLAGAGRLIEAEIAERERLRESLRMWGKFSARTADAVNGLSMLMLQQGRYGDADALAQVALEIWEGLEVPRTASRYIEALVSLGDIASLRRDWPRALVIYDEAVENLSEDPAYAQTLVGQNTNYALALINTGHLSRVLPLLVSAHEQSLATLGTKHQKTAELAGLLAVAKYRNDDTVGVQRLFNGALSVLYTRSRQASNEGEPEAARGLRLAVIVEGYLEFLASLSDKDARSRAFETAQLIRSRSVQGALDKAGARATANKSALAARAREEQDIQKQIATLNGRLAFHLSLNGAEHDEAVIDTLRKRIDTLRDKRATLMTSLEAEFPEYAALINPKPLSLSMAQSYLEDDEALISFYVGKKESYVWALASTGEVEFASIAYGEAELELLIGVLRSAVNPDEQTLGDIPAFDLNTAYVLFEALLEPVGAAWKDKDHLLVVPHKALGSLPLSVLPVGDSPLHDDPGVLFSAYQGVPWLVRDHSVVTLPSVVSLRVLRELPPADENRLAFAGFANPVFSDEQVLTIDATEDALSDELSNRGLGLRGVSLLLRSAPQTKAQPSADLGMLPSLPDTQGEVEDIARVLGADLQRDIFLGVAANEAAVKGTDLSKYKVIAFATHGLVAGDLDGLDQPALAFSSPAVVGDSQDGLLTLNEILALRLNADWVVLSACNTGTGDTADSEALSGLGRAFLYAGARALLVSNWPVETTSAKRLTVDLFRGQESNPALGRAEALRQSMLSLLDSPGYLHPETGEALFSYAHPIFWAPFTLVGDAGRAMLP